MVQLPFSIPCAVFLAVTLLCAALDAGPQNREEKAFFSVKDAHEMFQKDTTSYGRERLIRNAAQRHAEEPGAFSKKDFIPLIQSGLNDADQKVVRTSLRANKQIGIDETVDDVITVYHDAGNRFGCYAELVKGEALHALAATRRGSAKTVVVTALWDENDPLFGATALQAIASSNDVSYLPELQKYAEKMKLEIEQRRNRVHDPMELSPYIANLNQARKIEKTLLEQGGR
ncbi:MAG: hypothetical protein JXA71_13300 [Chitinispirillaceae bacterium]|nr:hypothetical protein [Chitinispirillaceae bacterium]